MSYDHLFKVVLVGDANVGKSAMLLQYTDKRFQPMYDLTIGIEFATKCENVLNNNCKLQIWDTAGQESFRSITRSYYRGAHGLVFVFDVTKRETLDHIQTWYDDTRRQCSDDVVPISILVGSKIDIQYNKRQITTNEATEYAERLGMSYWEISAKTGINIDEVFKDITRSILINGDFIFKSLFKKQDNKLIYKLHDNNLLNAFNALKSVSSSIREQFNEELSLYPVRILMELNKDIFQDTKKIADICEIISILSPYIVEMDIVNFGAKEIFDELIKSASKTLLTKCKIMTSMNGEVFDDYRLYDVAASNVVEFEFEIDEKLSDEFIAALRNNHKLESLYLHIKNAYLNNTNYIETLCKILISMKQNELCRLKSLQLSFEGNAVCSSDNNDNNDNTSNTADKINSNIIECIASKSKYIESLEIICKNIANSMVNLFDDVFCTQLFQIELNKLFKLNLDFYQSKWDDIAILSLSQFISKTNTLQQLSINGQLFSKPYDEAKGKQALAILTYSINSSRLNKILLRCFHQNVINHGLSSFVKLIKSSKISHITLSFDDISINDGLIPLLNGWIYHIKQLYKYYKDIKQYINDCNTLSMFNDKIKTEIYEYCQLQEYKLYIDAPIAENKQFLIIEYLLNQIQKMLVDANLLPQMTEISAMSIFSKTMDALNEMIKLITPYNDNLNIFVEEKPVIIRSEEQYNELKWDFLASVDHSCLCFGYIRNIGIQCNLLIPSPIYGIIWQFYPQYQVYDINPDHTEIDGQNVYKLEKLKHLSVICDNPYIHPLDARKLCFKPMMSHGVWYEIDDDYSCQICDDLNLQKDINKEYELLPKNNNSFIDIVCSGNQPFNATQEGLRIISTNIGDLLLLSSEPKMLFSSSDFLLNNTNNHRIIDVQSSMQHALILTSAGNIFSFGQNDKGQCGLKNVDDIKDDKDKRIEKPFHLKTLSEKFIKSIHIGANFNFCLDKDNDLYCFGSNEYNKLGLQNNKINEENIIWEPILHSYFNGKNGRIAIQIRCAVNLVVFIDNLYQCYWSGKHFGGFYHWNKSKDEYNDVKIVHALCADRDSDDDEALVVMIDSEHRLKIELSGNYKLKDEEEPLPYAIIEGLDENTNIDNLFFSLKGIMIVTSQTKL